ncbi:hypothetical protein GC163_19730 [bacterium]|nr:hypothetical protein [bacterium]
MIQPLEQVLEMALELSSEDRARLGNALIESLDVESDSETAESWASEIQQRLQQLDDQSVDRVSRKEAMQIISESYCDCSALRAAITR